MGFYDMLTSRTATIFLHELLHIDWITRAGKYGANERVSDLWLYTHDGTIRRALGPKWAQTLTRWEVSMERVAQAAWSNADNLALFAMAMYIQLLTGDVRSFPYPDPPPLDVGDGNPYERWK